MTVESALPDYAAEWLKYLAPERLAAGQTGSAYMEVKNTGAKSWPHSCAEAIRLGYRWLDAQEQGVLVDGAQTWPLSRSIAPGAIATPQTPGTYRLVWDLNQDGSWVSDQGAAVAEHPVQILLPKHLVEWHVLELWPARVPPDQGQLVSLRLRNIGT